MGDAKRRREHPSYGGARPPSPRDEVPSSFAQFGVVWWIELELVAGAAEGDFSLRRRGARVPTDGEALVYAFPPATMLTDPHGRWKPIPAWQALLQVTCGYGLYDQDRPLVACERWRASVTEIAPVATAAAEREALRDGLLPRGVVHSDKTEVFSVLPREGILPGALLHFEMGGRGGPDAIVCVAREFLPPTRCSSCPVCVASEVG